ncbi:MAG: hypothetical protein KDA58_02235, partial [Planctomycetaceae bacterium]|nr:hypothetical protein [Planctomycetaceae bacterium]
RRRENTMRLGSNQSRIAASAQGTSHKQIQRFGRFLPTLVEMKDGSLPSPDSPPPFPDED